jgi:hypothetical protein
LTCDFWAENEKRKTTAIESVASPFGLCPAFGRVENGRETGLSVALLTMRP